MPASPALGDRTGRGWNRDVGVAKGRGPGGVVQGVALSTNQPDGRANAGGGDLSADVIVGVDLELDGGFLEVGVDAQARHQPLEGERTALPRVGKVRLIRFEQGREQEVLVSARTHQRGQLLHEPALVVLLGQEELLDVPWLLFGHPAPDVPRKRRLSDGSAERACARLVVRLAGQDYQQELARKDVRPGGERIDDDVPAARRKRAFDLAIAPGDATVPVPIGG